MRSSVALAGSTAVLMAVLLSGCDDDSGSGSGSGLPGIGGPSTAAGGNGPAAGGTTAAPESGVKAAAGDWVEDTTSSTPIKVHADEDGRLTLDYGSRTLRGQLVELGDRHFRILLIAPDGKRPPEVTADLSADGQTITVTSTDEDGPVIYKRVG